jgi:DNA polymerase-3 subunit gamma/tau
MKSYHTKHRPIGFETVKGQRDAVAKLQRVIDKGTSSTFLIYGPSGCGKTTLARICAAYAGCEPSDVLEVDAATNSGADDTRKLQEIMAYRPIGGGEKRAIIVDECHRLSSTAWDTLLKVTEEPNEFCLWFFCTTNPAKVPETIKTRCAKAEVKSLPDREIESVLQRVIKREKLEIPEGVLAVIIREAKGSARQALVNLAEAEGCTTSKEAAAAIHTMLESDPIIELCRFLLSPGSWVKCMGIVAELGENPDYEGIRIVVVNYMGKVLQGAKSDEKAAAALTILENWSTPYNPAERQAPFMLSLGRTILGG